MTDNNEDLVSGLSNKIQKLMSLYEGAKQEINGLKLENLELTTKIVENERKIKNIENQYTKFKTTKTSNNTNSDISETKSKINQIVREIDKCISLLNI